MQSCSVKGRYLLSCDHDEENEESYVMLEAMGRQFPEG